LKLGNISSNLGCPGSQLSLSSSLAQAGTHQQPPWAGLAGGASAEQRSRGTRGWVASARCDGTFKTYLLPVILTESLQL